MPRLFWKLFLALWLSIMAFTLLIAVVQAVLAQRNAPDGPEFNFERGAQRAEMAITRQLRQDGPDGVRRLLESWPRQFRDQVFVFDANRRELLGRNQAWQRIAHSDLRREQLPISDGRGHQFTLVVVQRPPPGRLLEPGRRGLVFRLLMTGLLSAVVSFFLARYLARPLENLGKATRRLAAGDLGARVGQPLAGRRDEFGQLARDFDQMAGHLQRMQQANRRLLRDVSHELRSPLARLRVALEIARNRGHEPVAGELDRIELESDRLEQLVGEVLDLLRESSESLPINPELFDLAEMLEDLREVVAYEAQDANGAIRLAVQSPLPVTADRELLWRALENLLRNALIHSGPGGQVLIEAGVDGAKDAIEIRVRDSGPGIPSAHLAHIFDPFYRVQEARERSSGGHGLGLAIAAAAVRRHRGEISAHNPEGGGLEILVRIPAGKDSITPPR